jgi:GT2 family glycosyltransferase
VNAERDKEISVVIVSYNTADLIGECLASLETGQGVPLEIFVVDNASSDGSAEAVRKGFPAVHLVENRVNRGFGPANNQVLSRCRGRYLVLLNPDAVARPGAFREMASFMDSHPRVGLAGPRITNPDGTPQDSVSFRYPGQKHTAGELAGLPGSIACVMGACQIVRPELMKRIGGFDEDFFLYGEDQDLCLRIRESGFEIGIVESAEVVHHGGKSERGCTTPEVWGKKMRAEYLFYEKHYLPGTIRRIARAHLLKARWRLAVLGLSLPFARDRAAAVGKMQKYLAQRDVVRQQRSRYR